MILFFYFKINFWVVYFEEKKLMKNIRGFNDSLCR